MTIKKTIKIDSIRPTEFLLPRDKLEEIECHYDGTIDSIQPIIGYEIDGNFYPENGNKRAYFLFSKGHNKVFGYVHEHDAEDANLLLTLAERAKSFGVEKVADLERLVVSRTEYENRMKNNDLA